MVSSAHALAAARNHEWKHRGKWRTYTETGQVAGDYHREKRRILQELGYTWEEIDFATNEPDPQAYRTEIKERSSHKKKKFEQLYDLVRLEGDVFDGLLPEQVKYTLLLRVLHLDHSIMGARATNIIRAQCALIMAELERQLDDASGYKPQLVRTDGTFAQKLHSKKLVLLPWRGWYSETQSCSTINLPHNFPDVEQRDLKWFAEGQCTND
jgi:hypothetical protein